MTTESGGIPTLTHLKDLIDLMREKGVLEMDLQYVRLKLGAPPAEPLPESEPRVAVKGKVGKDGLTAEQQEALYMRVIDAE